MIKSFAMPEVWNTLIQFSIIALGILVGNIMRTKIPFLQRSLIPSALLGGTLILLFKALPGMGELVDKTFMEIVTYHALGLGFVALALKNNKIESKSSTMTVIETGALTANTYIIQGIAGLLLPMGYAQGPGQALNFGVIFSNLAESQGIAFSGADFGLSLAAMGFVVGSVVGVVFLNILSKSGKIKISKIKEKQVNTLDDYEGENEIPDTESVDKMSIQICLVLFTYFLVFLFCNYIEGLDLGTFGEKTLKPLLWGFNFLIGTLFGVILKWVLHGFKKTKIVKREYINNYLLNRISGFAFDVMIVAGTAAINFSELNEFAIPFILVCVIGAASTFIYVLMACKHIYPNYPYEGFLSMFGMLTGTASNGMILLREIDPKFETPAANNLVLQLLPASLLGLPILLLMGFAPRSFTHTLVTLGILLVLFVAFTLFIFRKKIFKKRYSKH